MSHENHNDWKKDKNFNFFFCWYTLIATMRVRMIPPVFPRRLRFKTKSEGRENLHVGQSHKM